MRRSLPRVTLGEIVCDFDVVLLEDTVVVRGLLGHDYVGEGLARAGEGGLVHTGDLGSDGCRVNRKR